MRQIAGASFEEADRFFATNPLQGRKRTFRLCRATQGRVDRALERNDEIGQAAHLLPAPLVEFRPVAPSARMADVDLAVVALEAEGEPFLRLPTIPPFQARPATWSGRS